MSKDNRVIDQEIIKLTKRQEAFLDNPVQAFRDYSLLPSNDGWAGEEYKDVLLYMRQKSYREGYRSGANFSWDHQQTKLDEKDKLLKEACKSLEHLIGLTNTNLEEWHKEGLVECRGDEDCDHCHQLSLSNDCQDFLNKPEIKALRGEK